MSRTRIAFATVAVASLIATSAPADDTKPSADARIAAVHAFVDAFNERDLERLLGAVHDDIEWLSVDGTDIAAEAGGRDALAGSLRGYFEACSSCRSDIEWAKPAGSRVAALERASWEREGSRISQVSLAVYEFEGDLIRRVYYFPADR